MRLALTAVIVAAVGGARLVQLHRGQRADGVALGFLTEQLDRPLQTELRRRTDRDREPQIEVVVALVVLRDAGVAVDHGRGFIDPLRAHARGDEAGAITERARVEVRADLANHSFALELLGAFDDLFLRHVDQLTDDRERS